MTALLECDHLGHLFHEGMDLIHSPLESITPAVGVVQWPPFAGGEIVHRDRGVPFPLERDDMRSNRPHV